MILPKIEDCHLYTHAGCMDGSTAAILFRHAGGKKQNIHWVAAGRVEHSLGESGAFADPNVPALLVDIAPSDEMFVRNVVARGNAWIIDHHASNLGLNQISPNFFVDKNNEACGSENFRRVLVENGHERFDQPDFKRFCRIVDDHDRWQMKIPFSLDMPKFFAFVGQKDFVERMMNVAERFECEKESYWTPFEQDLMNLLKRIQETRYRATFEKMQVLDKKMLGRWVKAAYVISDEVNNSEMMNIYLKEHPEIDVAVQISFGLQKVSFRSNDRVDCSQLAKKYGGGGHKNAAGHPLPNGMIHDIIWGMHE